MLRDLVCSKPANVCSDSLSLQTLVIGRRTKHLTYKTYHASDPSFLELEAELLTVARTSWEY